MPNPVERAGDWLDETHGPNFELVRHFFRSFFDSELLSTRGKLQVVITSALSLFAAFGLVAPIFLNHKYHLLNELPTPDLYTESVLADKLLFVTLSMIVSAAVTAVQWQSLFPQAQDLLILGPLPLRRIQIFITKFAALLLFVTTFNFLLNCFSSVMLPQIMHGRWQYKPTSMMHIVAHGAACMLAGYFVFFSLLALQGLVMNLLPARLYQRLSLFLQSLMLMLILCAAPLAIWIPNLHALMNTRPPLAVWLPPVWFLGLYETILGSADVFGRHLARLAVMGLFIAIAASVGFYAITYRRQTSRLLEVAKRNRPGTIHALASSLLQLLLPHSRERAVFSFIAKTLMRSRLHKLLLAIFAGVGFALVVDSFASLSIASRLSHKLIRPSDFQNAIFSAPLIVCFFLLTGLRYLFSIPVEPRGNWIFRLTEKTRWLDAMNATEKALFALGVLPITVLTLVLYGSWFGWHLAALHTAFVLILALLLLEAMLWNWEKIPFTCPYLPGKRNMIQLLLLYWLSLSLFAYVMTTIERWCFRQSGRTIVLFVALLAAFLFVRRHRKEGWGEDRLKFDDTPEPDVMTLGLQPE